MPKTGDAMKRAGLLDHISKHRYYLGLEQKRDIGWQESTRR
jgi:hypothetical protein